MEGRDTQIYKYVFKKIHMDLVYHLSSSREYRIGAMRAGTLVFHYSISLAPEITSGTQGSVKNK